MGPSTTLCAVWLAAYPLGHRHPVLCKSWSSIRFQGIRVITLPTRSGSTAIWVIVLLSQGCQAFFLQWREASNPTPKSPSSQAGHPKQTSKTADRPRPEATHHTASAYDFSQIPILPRAVIFSSSRYSSFTITVGCHVCGVRSLRIQRAAILRSSGAA